MKILSGKVISTKMEKTAVVAVERVIVHPIYKKRVRKIKKYHVHDLLGTNVGQIVNFVACKPISKTKKWKIIENKKSIKGKKTSKTSKKVNNSKTKK